MSDGKHTWIETTYGTQIRLDKVAEQVHLMYQFIEQSELGEEFREFVLYKKMKDGVKNEET